MGISRAARPGYGGALDGYPGCKLVSTPSLHDQHRSRTGSPLRRAFIISALILCLVIAGAVATLAYDWLVRPGVAALRTLELPPTDSAEGLQLTWLGVSTLVISDGETQLLTDPFVSRPRLAAVLLNQRLHPDESAVKSWVKRLGLENLNAMLVGHSHYDHIQDVGAFGRHTRAMLIGSATSIQIGLGHGIPEQRSLQIQPGEAIRIGEFEILFIASRHAGATGGRPLGDVDSPLQPPARASDYKQGGSYSILFRHPQGTLLYHGSAGFVAGALTPYSADVVLLGIALLPDLETYLREVVDAVGAHTVLPVHWDDFTRPLDEPLEPLPFIVDIPAFLNQTRELRPELQIRSLPLGVPVRMPTAAE